jgi:hypothetical protein
MSIEAGSIQIQHGRPLTDFGQGFYTTTCRRQAASWAKGIAVRKRTSPAVVRLALKYEELAELDTLAFVRGAVDADHYWSFVTHCRSGGLHHQRTGSGGPFYDLVYGPVAIDWRKRVALADSDQTSFHTPRAERLLNRATRMTEAL